MIGAIMGEHKEMADLLIKHGVKVSQADVKFAEDEGHSEVVALLKRFQKVESGGDLRYQKVESGIDLR